MKQELSQPKIKISKSAIDYFFEISAFLTIFFMWIFSIYNYHTLPENIPVHWGADGLADDYASKKMIFLLPIIITLLTTGLKLLNQYPHKFNYITFITEENAERQYKMAARLIRYLQFIISAFFAYILVKTVNDAHLHQSKLSICFVLILISAVMVPTVYTVYAFLVKK